jgi:pSer/pThr/pTyr-binding forkhead associated (FHA) protein
VPEQLLTILKLCLLALLYLFFLRVLRVVWLEVREPQAAAVRPSTAAAATIAKPRRREKRAPRGPTRLVLHSPPELAGTSHTLTAEMTIGRAPGCTIAVEDGYVSSVHTRVFGRDGQWLVEDLGSTNGTYLNRRKVTGPSTLRVGDRIQVGNAEFEVR